MSRSYMHLKVLEEAIFEQKAQEKSNREIREQYGLSKKQMEDLINRHNSNRCHRRDIIEAKWAYAVFNKGMFNSLKQQQK